MADWARVAELFEQALEQPATERRDFLDRACGGDGELRSEVLSLLAAERKAGEFLDRSALERAAEAEDGEPAPRRRSIGPYKLLRQIGEGGMSTVYLATRADDEYRQDVAIKVFALGQERRDLLRRFRTERQILATLVHPSIARLLDGGTTGDGLPYIVMERVEGEPIDAYCDRLRLPLDRRIELFRSLCSAVQYAHQRLVVHRDLKPANVLVTAGGEPKLLDFGIAKLIHPELFPETVQHTAAGQRLMTPHYASPEQVQGAPITTASDVYSMGVLLYKLLTGHLPYGAAARLTTDLERAVLEEEPERPSTAVARVTAAPATGRAATGRAGTGVETEVPLTPQAVSHARGTGPARLRRQLEGDLENILLKALRKEPDRPYGSIERLDEDLRRYQQGLPVLARPAGLGYRGGKFIRRHRWGVAAAAAFLLLVVGFAAVMWVQAARIARERDEARRERDKARAVAAFLEDIFRVSDPGQARGETVTAREILDRGAGEIERELAGQPEVRSALEATIGNVYRQLGLLEEAEPHLQRSLDERREVLGAEHPEAADSLIGLALLRRDQGRLDDAEELLRQALELHRRDPGDDGSGPAAVLQELGEVQGIKGDLAAAEAAFREGLELRRGLYGGGDERVAESMGSLSKALREQGRLEAAAELCTEALRIERRVFGEPHPRVAARLNDLAVLRYMAGELEAAADLYGEAVDQARELYGEAHPLVATYLNNLAVAHGARGDLEAAEPLFRRVLELRRELLGEDHPDVANSLGNLGRLLRERGDFDAAEGYYRQAVDVVRRTQGDSHPWVNLYLENLAALYRDRGQLARAEPLFQQVIELRRRYLGSEHPQLGWALVGYGGLLVARGAAGEAEPRLRQGLEILRAALGDEHWRTAEAESVLGAGLAALGRDADAEPLLRSGYETLAEQRGADHRFTRQARERLIDFYETRGRGGEAAGLRGDPP